MNKFYYTYKITLLKGSLARHWKKDPETGKRIFYRND